MKWFDNAAKKAAWLTGSSTSFTLAVAVVLLWMLTGPFFRFSDTWQLVINTATSVLTFLMVFLIQSTQNRDTAAMHVKLDELIRAVQGAHNAMIGLEDMGQEDLLRIREVYAKLSKVAKAKVEQGGADIDCPKVEMDLEVKVDGQKAKFHGENKP